MKHQIERYEKAIEMYDRLVEQGLIKETKYRLMPLEERHKSQLGVSNLDNPKRQAFHS